MVLAALVFALALAQRQAPANSWTVLPGAPTVGDTLQLERRFTLPAGWRLRPSRLEATETVEPLQDPEVIQRGGDWVVRYAVVAWMPGAHSITFPPVWRLGVNGAADSVPGGTATFTLASVIPDSITKPMPKPALAPLRPERQRALPVILAALVTGLSLGGALWWRRRRRRLAVPASHARHGSEVADDRWLNAGEPKAVAARAAGRLRSAVARLIPEAHGGLSTAECLEVVRRRRPQTRVVDLAAVLGALDHVAFGAEGDDDVAALARRAESLAQELER